MSRRCSSSPSLSTTTMIEQGKRTRHLTWHRFPNSWKICSFSSAFRRIVPLCLSVLPDFMLSHDEEEVRLGYRTCNWAIAQYEAAPLFAPNAFPSSSSSSPSSLCHYISAPSWLMSVCVLACVRTCVCRVIACTRHTTKDPRRDEKKENKRGFPNGHTTHENHFRLATAGHFASGRTTVVAWTNPTKKPDSR